MKGNYKCECNRKACDNNNAKFYNHSTLKYYCGSCAYEINKWAPEFEREKGHKLCLEVRCPVCKSKHVMKDLDYPDTMLNCKDCGSEFYYDGEIIMNSKKYT